jgi:hypothetical protein
MEKENDSISFFRNCTEKQSVEITLDELFNKIKTGEEIKPLIETIRNSQNKSEIDLIKKKLPAVTVSAIFGECRKKEFIKKHTGLIQIDLDKVDNIHSVIEQLKKDKYTFALFISPTGTGIKLIVRINNNINEHEFNFIELDKYYLLNYKLQIDKSCKDLTRLMYLSYDKDLFINKNSELFNPELINEQLINNLIDELNKKELFNEGNRNNYIYKLATKCSKNGLSILFTKNYLIKLFKNHDFSELEIINPINSAFNNSDNLPKEPIKRNKELNSKLSIIENFINSKYELRNNIISNKIECKEKGSNEGFKELNENNIYRDLAHNHHEFSLNKLKSLLCSDFVEKFNPFEDYFKSLKKWDSENEIDYIEKLASYLPIKDPERFKIHLKKMLARFVVCALEDNYFNKHALILVHDIQSSGKTTFCRWLCPPILNDYITENINTDKDSLIALSTNFIINMDELATLSKADLNMLKSFMSKDKINARLPFASRTTQQPRRANFIGSTNKDEFLNDETGSVRWLCFELLDKINFAYKIDININDIYRQAYTLYKEGFKYDLTQSEIEENDRANKSFMIETQEMQLIPKYFKPSTKEKNGEFLTSSDILKELASENFNFKSHIQIIGKALKILGFPKDSKYNEELRYTIKGYYIQRVIR